jgi:hypothetical protein
MATAKQNREFSDIILNQDPLDEAIEYIKKNFNPEDVFDDKELAQWALDNGFKEDTD